MVILGFLYVNSLYASIFLESLSLQYNEVHLYIDLNKQEEVYGICDVLAAFKSVTKCDDREGGRGIRNKKIFFDLYLSNFALYVYNFALHVYNFALHVYNFALYFSSFALYVPKFALYVSKFALYLSKFALYVSDVQILRLQSCVMKYQT